MDHRKTCFCCCTCSYQTGTIFIATMYIVQPIVVALTTMYAAASVAIHGVPAMFLISWFILVALGLVLLCGADKRDPCQVATFYLGGWVLLALRVVFAVVDFAAGELENFFGEAVAVALNVVLLSVVHTFMKEIKAEPMAEAADDNNDGSCCCSLQTGVVFFGSTFIITSIPGATWLVYALFLPMAPTTPSAIPVYLVLGLLFCTVYIVLGTWLLTGADRRSVSRTWAGLAGICILMSFRVVGLLLWTDLYWHTNREKVVMLEAGIVFVHICALVTVRMFMAQIRNGAAD